MSAALDRFLEHYFRRRPVNATFTGVHEYDDALPDWSESGLWSLDAEMHALRAELASAYPHATSASAQALNGDIDLLDARLSIAFLDIQLAENASRHGPRGNPALWSGEAVFSVVSLLIRDFASAAERAKAIVARLQAIPAFLAEAPRVLEHAPIPAPWADKAQRDGTGASILLTHGLHTWVADHEGALSPAVATAIRTHAAAALVAFEQFTQWLRARPEAPNTGMACGAQLYDVLLSQGHQCERSRAELLADARAAMMSAKARLHAVAEATAGSWEKAQTLMAADHAAPEGYLDAFARTWARCREHALRYDVVTWPEWPLRYVTFPAATRDAAPYLYYLYYRSPAPFDPYTTYDYVVPPLPEAPDAVERHLRVWNASTVTLNHVVHHGAIGHHVQNWHAYHQATSRIGRIAAVDCANRVGMFCAGTMAEGWACYATELMEELDFLSPLERLSEQHSRIRFLARAIVDIELHQGSMTVEEAIRFYADEVGMSPEVARAETIKNAMFPCTAVMYWLGTQGILDLRKTLQRTQGAQFNLKRFHDTLLGHGSIPVPLVSRLMTVESE